MVFVATNVVSELRRAKAGKGDCSAVAWSANVHGRGSFIFAIYLLAQETGVMRVQHRYPQQGSLRRPGLAQWSRLDLVRVKGLDDFNQP
jgi:hypothetical protein